MSPTVLIARIARYQVGSPLKIFTQHVFPGLGCDFPGVALDQLAVCENYSFKLPGQDFLQGLLEC